MRKIINLGLILISFCLFSQSKSSADKLIAETQQITQSGKNLKMVWWIPTEYWRIAVQDQNVASDEQIEYLESILNDYTIVIVGDYTIDSKNGNIAFSVKDFKDKVSFYGLQGQKISALNRSEINNQLLTIIDSTLKPLFGQMLGKMGTGVEFFIYNNTKDNKRIIDPTKTGDFKVEVNKEPFPWKLPLVSLMKEKICSVDKEKMEGNWLYCPFHGVKLQ